MKKLGLLSLAASIAVTSSLAGKLDLVSDLKIEGDARVRSVSVEGSTATSNSTAATYKDKQELESRIRINLDFKTVDDISVHTRVVADNNAWGNNSNDTFTWDEAYILAPFNKDKFLLAGRVNDTYGTPFYGSNGDKIDLAFIGYTPRPDILLYAFDYKAVEGSVNDQGSSLGLSSTGNGDFDAYSVGGQIKIDELTTGGRYVFLQDNQAITGGGYHGADSHMVNAFAMGSIGGFDIQTQVEKRFGDKYSGGIVDEKMFGAYLNVSKQLGAFNVGAAVLKTENGYVSGPDLPISYLANDDFGMAALGRVGKYGDTLMYATNFKYDVTPELTLEANLAKQTIDKATFSSLNKDLDVTEYDLGFVYQLSKSASCTLRYANGSFDNSSLKDLNVVVGAVEIKF